MTNNFFCILAKNLHSFCDFENKRVHDKDCSLSLSLLDKILLYPTINFNLLKMKDEEHLPLHNVSTLC
jgi:hypothetical protein